MRIAAGILLLIAGVSFPLGVLFWLSRRLGRLPALPPRQVGLLLAFNGIFPLGLIVLGLGLLSSRLWATLAFKAVIVSTGLVALILLTSLWWGARVVRRHGGEDG